MPRTCATAQDSSSDKTEEVKCTPRAVTPEEVSGKKPRRTQHRAGSPACELVCLGNEQDRGSLAWAFRSVRLRRDPRCHLHYGLFQDEKLENPSVTETNFCEE